MATSKTCKLLKNRQAYRLNKVSIYFEIHFKNVLQNMNEQEARIYDKKTSFLIELNK